MLSAMLSNEHRRGSDNENERISSLYEQMTLKRAILVIKLNAKHASCRSGQKIRFDPRLLPT